MIIKALGPVIIVVDEADAVFGNRSSSGDSGVSTRVFAAFAAHIGDSSLRGREIWIAMTSRPDLMAIDMKRQGRFGLCMPLFPAKDDTELKEMFTVVSKVNKVNVTDEIMATVLKTLSGQRLTGSEVESIVLRAKERAVLAKRDDNVMVEDYIGAIESFIDPLDPQLLRMQELAAVLACSDKRYLPELYLNAKREELYTEFLYLKSQLE
jgi:SpoVK/Ycf46/Vps4 family AAA+-type ATPase